MAGCRPNAGRRPRLAKVVLQLAHHRFMNPSGFDAGFIVEAPPDGTPGCERSRQPCIRRPSACREHVIVDPPVSKRPSSQTTSCTAAPCFAEALRTRTCVDKCGNAAWCGLDFGETTAMPVRFFNDANAFHRAMRAIAATKAGRVLFRPTAHRLDQLVSKLTGGKRSFAGIAAGLPSVILTATGAKSGKPRTVALLGIPHPDGVAVVAANYGDAKHPVWYHKLKANPAATVVKCQWVSAT
jgi:hypothetical protein